MHEQRLQIVPALGSPSAAPYPRPLLSRDTPGPGDRQQKKPGLLSCRRFLYTAPSRSPARSLRTRLLSFRSLEEPSSSLWRAGIVPEVRPIRPRTSAPRLGPGQSPQGRGASRTQSSNLQQSPGQRDPALQQQAHLAPPGDCGSTRRSGEGLSSVCYGEAAPRDRLHLVLSKDFSPPRLREIEPTTTKKSLITIYGLAIVLASLSFFPPQ